MAMHCSNGPRSIGNSCRASTGESARTGGCLVASSCPSVRCVPMPICGSSRVPGNSEKREVVRCCSRFATSLPHHFTRCLELQHQTTTQVNSQGAFRSGSLGQPGTINRTRPRESATSHAQQDSKRFSCISRQDCSV